MMNKTSESFEGWPRSSFPMIAGMSLLAITSPLSAAVIGFETTPTGATPTAETELTESYTDGGTTITLGFSTSISDLNIDSNALFDNRTDLSPNDGSDPAYTSGQYPGIHNPDGTDSNVGDGVVDGQGGTWMLKNGTQNLTTQAFIISYSGDLPTSASGQIWDIDAAVGNTSQEQYTVRAYNDLGVLIAEQMSPLGLFDTEPGSLDALPWSFNFNNLAEPIKTIAIHQSAGPQRGFAFDGFNATQPVPEPGTASLLGLGVLGFLLRRKRTD